MDLFGTAGIRGAARDDVTPELALSVGRAVARDATEVVVGRDGRTSGPGLAAAVTSGVLSGGAEVRRVGVVPTPALAFVAQERTGVMLTASHNPPPDNGIKVFEDGVEYDRAAERRIEERVDAGSPPAEWDAWGASEPVDVLPSYRESVVEYAGDQRLAEGRRPDGHSASGDAPLDGLQVVVDAGNGTGALATPQVLRALGADVDALNANVDGHFPGRESKPTRDALADARDYVASTEVDFGIAHDGDADRIVVIDGHGEVVQEDTIVAILAEHYVEASDAEDPVAVTTPNASARIDERVREKGGRVERVRLGALHEGVATVHEGGGNVVFAAEPWKHVHPAWGGWIDGVASAGVLSRLVADAGGLDRLREPITERPYRKTPVECPEELKAPAMELVAERLPAAFPDGTVDTEYGVRIDLPDGSWVLVRPSGTEPYLRTYAESDDVDAVTKTVLEIVGAAVREVRE
jgi:phosphomannomutase